MARDMYGFALLTSQEDAVAQRSLDAAWAAVSRVTRHHTGYSVHDTGDVQVIAAAAGLLAFV